MLVKEALQICIASRNHKSYRGQTYVIKWRVNVIIDINSLAHESCHSNSKNLICKRMLRIQFTSSLWNCYEMDVIEHIWWYIAIGLGNYHYLSGNYLSLCCPWPMSPYGVNRLQWVNSDDPCALQRTNCKSLKLVKTFISLELTELPYISSFWTY